MKLYTRMQVIALCAALGIVTLAMGGAGAALFLRSRPAEPSPAVSQQVTKTPKASSIPVQYTGPSVTNAAGLTEDEQNTIDVYDKANKAVVYITTVTMEYTWFYEAIPQEGTGSGVIIDQDGHVLTNYHVVKGADKISMTLADGSVVDAKITGLDPENDIAVLQFNPKGMALTTIPIGNSSNLRVGMKVLAIGNPFGYDRTLTIGIVSGLARPIETDDGYLIRETIQTDAAINPGNSGGPLLNSRGELIGINTMIVSPSGASAGVGFAVAVNTARRIAEELIQFGEVRRGWIDIDPIQLFPSLVSYFKLPIQKGILVSAARTNALAAGIRGGDPSKAVRSGRSIIYGGGDIIVAVNKMKTETLSDFMNALEDTKPGEPVEVKMVRGTQERTVTVKLVQKPGSGN